MSRLLIAANSEFLETDTPVVTDPPATFFCWARTSDVTTDQCLMAILDKDSTTQYLQMIMAGAVAGDPLEVRSRAGGGASVRTSTTAVGFLANVWYPCAMVWTTLSS